MILLSRYKLAAFLACQRRFQLRYEQGVPWPVAPQPPTQAEALAQGEQFHRLLERYFLGLTVDAAALPSPLRQWWQTWQTHTPPLPPGRRLPEFRLTVPVGQHLLLGRFDLLILTDETVMIYDWKTERRPRAAATLHQDWQTRLYLAIVAEGIMGIQPSSQPITPEQIQLCYWFVEEPQASVTFRYSQAEHDQNWAELNAIVARLDSQLSDPNPWPLTDDLNECGRCAYQLLCARPQPLLNLDNWYEETESDLDLSLEPTL
ncbi:MAG: PD-(D/E)XK nuclease family protein [Anaerolineae bacterium]|nr:PD-(D/E)XK nuclease family protein [Anaerolineae bacterium]